MKDNHNILLSRLQNTIYGIIISMSINIATCIGKSGRIYSKTSTGVYGSRIRGKCMFPVVLMC
jgi:hypothetical protein